MATNEILERAKALDKSKDSQAVIQLLKDYIKNDSSDKTALAFYVKNLTLKFFLDNKITADQLYGNQSGERYVGLSKEEMLQVSAYHYANALAIDFLERNDEILNLSYVWLNAEIETLNDYLYEFVDFEKQMDNYYKTLISFGIEPYYILSQFIDWNSNLSDNMVKYIERKVKPIIQKSVHSDEDIYNSYTKNMKSKPFPAFSKMPKADKGYIFVSSKEEKDFWLGYFQEVKKVKENELKNYRLIAKDENHADHDAYSAYKFVYYKLEQARDELSTDEFFKWFKVITDFAVTEDDFTKKINQANQVSKQIFVSPIVVVKEFFKKIFAKFKK